MFDDFLDVDGKVKSTFEYNLLKLCMYEYINFYNSDE